MFCECEGCVKARRNGGNDIRRRCTYLIDDDMLLDYSPDIYGQSLTFNIDLSKINTLLVSHSHTDHLAAHELYWRRKGFSSARNIMNIYGNQAVLDKINGTLGPNGEEDMRCRLHLVLPGDIICGDGFSATAILADHAAPPELPLNYIIQRNGITAYIGTDTGWLCEESWNTLKKFKLDIAIIECTFGLKWPNQREKHMGSAVSVEVRDEMRRLGILKDDALVAVNHFSHNCQNLHSDFQQYFNPLGIQVGYDGMVLEKI